jgi:hypothetical protein
MSRLQNELEEWAIAVAILSVAGAVGWFGAMIFG